MLPLFKQRHQHDLRLTLFNVNGKPFQQTACPCGLGGLAAVYGPPWTQEELAA